MNRYLLSLRVLFSLACCVFFCGLAFADGGIFELDTGAGFSADQRAILAYDPDTKTETLVLSTQYAGDPVDFAWLVPVASTPTAIAPLEDGESAFTSLYYVTAPRAFYGFNGSGGVTGCGGCGGDGGSAPVPTDDLIGVNVVEQLHVNGLEISVLDATSADELAQWLSLNSYRFPEAGKPVLNTYINNGWKFVAVKVDNAADQTATVSRYFPQHPLKLTFTAEQPVFPLCISSINSDSVGSEVLLYVISRHRMTCTTFPTVDMEMTGVHGSSSEALAQSYEAHFAGKLEQPGGRAFVVEYAGPFDPTYQTPGLNLDPAQSYFLTRLRGRFLPSQMTHDAVLTDADADTPLELTARMTASTGLPLQQAALALALACGCLLLRRAKRRQDPWRWSAVGLLTLLLFAALWNR